MSLSPDFIAHICTVLGNGGAARPDVDIALREAFPGIPFSVCSDNDIPSRIKPIACGEGFALYGINTSDHCAALTTDLDTAGGIAIALIDDDD